MPRYAAARLAQKNAAYVIVVAFHGSHFVEHGPTLRRQHSPDNHIAHFTFRVTTDHGDQPP
jgi:hypothetical protein